jgi:hypothetical protein
MVMSNSASTFLHNHDTHFGFLKESYILLIVAYEELRDGNYKTSGKNENNMRDDIVRIAEKKETSLKFEWDTESRDLLNTNRVDITLITEAGLGEGFDKRITIECKIVGENEYINRNGISSFVSNKYAEKMPLAGMIGFVKTGNTTKKVEKIKQLLNQHTTIQTTQNLEFYECTKTFSQSYKSQHQRYANKSIDIYHLFFDFT